VGISFDEFLTDEYYARVIWLALGPFLPDGVICKESNMSTYAGKLHHPINGYAIDVYTGFNWPCLFLGTFWFAYKGLWGWAILAFIFFPVTLGFSNIIFAFIANQQHQRLLLKSGYLHEW